VATSTFGTTPSTSTASGMVLLSTSAPVNTRHTRSAPRGLLTTTRGRPHYCSVLTFYYVGFRKRSLHDRRHGLGLREGSGLLGGRRGNFVSCRRAGFITVPGQVS
jgi:hypothetical protein